MTPRMHMVVDIILLSSVSITLWACAANSNEALPLDFTADRIVVFKEERKLQIIHADTIAREYNIALGSSPEGHKIEKGDGRTPEGNYTIDYRNPESAYHLSLHISYPNAEDIRDANLARRDPGGEIFIHGLPNGSFDWGRWHTLLDWTQGCIALTNNEIEELWDVCPDGTPIEIRP